MALMARPALLIMDEPTTGLDVTIEAAILELVRDLRQRFDAAILFISHNLGTIARVCDHVGVLYAGRLVELGSLRGIFRAPAHPYTRGLLGALPRLDGSGRHGRLHPIEGTISTADRARRGCAFAPRCAFALPDPCVERPVALVPVAGEAGHVARCARLAAVAAAAPPIAPVGGGGADAADAPVLLEVRHLGKRYDIGGRFGGRAKRSVRAVSDVSFEARAGGTLAIVGESGCGKSTLAKVISGLLTASEGEARLGGVDLAATPVDKRPRDLRRRIQMVFQNPDSTLNPSHSVEFALTRPLRVLGGVDRGEARERAARLLDEVRLPRDVLRRLPHQLSGGQRQRVAIARALAGEPDLMIADEPVSALDVSVQAAILNLLADLLAGGRLGLILISHDLALVRHMADWVAVMYLGRVVEYGPADAVFAPPHHPYTEALLAAAPRPDPDAGAPAIVLAGTMPSPSEEIVGCVFASRCPHRIDGLCETTPPPVRDLGGRLTIACHLELGATRH
jgi:peptide/nickel transport system ATP-binding protein